MDINKVKVGKRFRKDIGELETLKTSIKEIGLLQPIVIDEKNNLIAGQRRLMACKELGMKSIKTNVVKIENALRGEYDENVIRKGFTPSEEVAIWDAMEKPKGGAGKTRSESEQVIKRASKLLSKSTDTLSKAKQVVESGDKELIEKMDRTGNVNGAYRFVKQKKDTEKILKEKPALEAKGLFKTILLDPPWDYEGMNLANRGIPEYSVMSLEQLRELKLPADENCHLYLWTTNNYLHEALKLGKQWGFNYKTIITWVKPSIGLGSYFRNSTEHCLFFVKGKLSTKAKNIPTHFEAKRLAHSEKPEESYDIIERASHPPYLEYFGRKKRKGWKVLGNL